VVCFFGQGIGDFFLSRSETFRGGLLLLKGRDPFFLLFCFFFMDLFRAVLRLENSKKFVPPFRLNWDICGESQRVSPSVEQQNDPSPFSVHRPHHSFLQTGR